MQETILNKGQKCRKIHRSSDKAYRNYRSKDKDYRKNYRCWGKEYEY